MTSHFWKGRRVLLTGHTGFKGAWMALWLERAGARVTGFALAPPPGRESLYANLAPWDGITSIIGDLNDPAAVAAAVKACDPEIIIHMAAQALVRRSYREPIETFATNVMGTANLLAASAAAKALKTILVITSDKVYDNRDCGRDFCENDPLAGDDPYSASKAAAEILVRSWRYSFLQQEGAPVLAVARAGNVIGGGDWGEDRLVPDIIAAGFEGKPVVLRYPDSTRPWQHVLDLLHGYLIFAEKLTTDPATTPLALNFGPAGRGITTSALVEKLQAAFGWNWGWQTTGKQELAEKVSLNLDPSRAWNALGWRTSLAIDTSLAWVAQWHRAHHAGEDVRSVSLNQLARFEDIATAERPI